MKKTLLILLVLSFSSLLLTAQIAVNSDGSSPDPSAMLDVKSTGLGFLPPRLSEVEKYQVSNPAEGLIIYNTTSKALEVFDGTTWVSMQEDGFKQDLLNYQVAIGGTGNDGAYSVFSNPDGTIMLAGYTESFGTGNSDMYVIKLTSDFTLDSSFNSTGTLTFGGTNTDIAWSVFGTADGNYMVGGYTQSYGAGGEGFYLAKITPAGQLNTAFGSSGSRTFGMSNNERCFDMIPVSDGGYVMAGYHIIPTTSNTQAYLAKFTSGGALDTAFATSGSLMIGGSGTDVFMKVKETYEHGLIAVGYTASYGAGANDVYIVKLTEDGDPDTGFGTDGKLVIGGSGEDLGEDVVQTADGGYLISAQTNSFGGGNYDGYIIKLTSSGALDNNFGTNGTLTAGTNAFDTGRGILLNPDGSFVVGGYTSTNGCCGYDALVMKFLPNGVPDSTFGTMGFVITGGTGHDYIYEICHDNGGGYLLAGSTASFGAGGTDMFLIHMDAAGGLCGNYGYGGHITGSGGTLSSGGNVSGEGTLGATGGSISSGGSLTTICN